YIYLQLLLPPPSSTLFPYTTLFRSLGVESFHWNAFLHELGWGNLSLPIFYRLQVFKHGPSFVGHTQNARAYAFNPAFASHDFQRSEEHTSELQSRFDLVCRLLLEKK